MAQWLKDIKTDQLEAAGVEDEQEGAEEVADVDGEEVTFGCRGGTYAAKSPHRVHGGLSKNDR